jgi:hypothetical protein
VELIEAECERVIVPVHDNVRDMETVNEADALLLDCRERVGVAELVNEDEILRLEDFDFDLVILSDRDFEKGNGATLASGDWVNEIMADDDAANDEEADTEGVIDGDSVEDGDSVTEGDSVAEDDSVADGDGDAVTDPDSVTDGDSVTEDELVADGDSVADGDVVTDGDSVADGERVADDDSVTV